ncbi:MAG TPA: response regulator [Burkholderiales bacterium]|nr:response regulator [Burkholderiales bacterium]
MHLLLVGADSSDLLPICQQLEAHGVRVRRAPPGHAALREVLGGGFAAVLIEGGLEGYETAAAIRSLRRPLPIVFLGAEGERRAERRDPQCAFLRTPVSVEALCGYLEALSSSSTPSDTSRATRSSRSRSMRRGSVTS